MISFSICHTTARPKKWAPARGFWRRNSGDWSRIEYVLCVDARWGFEPTFKDTRPTRIVWNEGRKSCIDGWNTAFAAATGDVLIMASDDFFPPEKWDVLLEEVIGNRDPRTQDFAIRVGSNNPNQQRDLWPTIISRARYERLGYALYPEYESGICADDDDCEHIKLDIAEGRTELLDARHIQFFEDHPTFTAQPSDAVYEYQNRPQCYVRGARILAGRREAKFANTEPIIDPKVEERLIALCLPGKAFDMNWLASYTELITRLMYAGWHLGFAFAYCADASRTRQEIIRKIAAQPMRPKYMLWLDHDNTITFDQVMILISDLETLKHPKPAAYAGWAWCADGMVSCGAVREDGSGLQPLDPKVLEQGAIIEVGYSGMPAVLMHTEVALALGREAFVPIPEPRMPDGYYAEDVSWCIRARAQGYHVYVDARVGSPHWKTQQLKGASAG